MANSFPREGNIVYVKGDQLGSDELASVRVSFGRMLVPVIEEGNTESFEPLGAIKVSGLRAFADCANGQIEYEVRSGLSRASFWLGPVTEQLQSGPPQIPFQIRGACNCITEILFEGVINLNNWGQQGLIVQVSGLLVDEFSFWARITAEQGAVPLKIEVQCLADRTSGCAVLDGDGNPVIEVIHGMMVPF
jgi:hypothetical protein